MNNNSLTIEQMYNDIAKVYCPDAVPTLNACTDILDMFEALGARTVKDIMRMIERLEKVL